MKSATTLRGSLEDLPIEDVLSLLHVRAHSGLLVVNPDQPRWLMMADGDVVLGGATSSMALGRYLLADGTIGAELLADVFGLVDGRLGERINKTLDDAEVLTVLAEHVPHEALAAAVRDQAISTVFEMMLSTSGEMMFNEATPHPLADRFRFPTGDIVLAAADRVANWDRLCALIGSDSSRLRRVRRVASVHCPVTLTAVEWAALSEIDDRATVGQIAHRLGRGRADTYALLADMMERGLVEPA